MVMPLAEVQVQTNMLDSVLAACQAHGEGCLLRLQALG